MIDANEDFVDAVHCLVDAECEFVIVGAYALAAHGIPRATGDIDIFVRPTESNAARVYAALLAFGAPIEAHSITPQDFAQAGTVYQMGLPPRCIGLAALIRNKRSTGRTKDVADAETLEELASRK